MRFLSLLLLPSVLAACAQDGDFRNGRQDEAYVDPAVWQIAQSLTGSFSNVAHADSTTDGVITRQEGTELWDSDEEEAWVFVQRTTLAPSDSSTRAVVYRVVYDRPYTVETYAVPSAYSSVAALEEQTPAVLTLQNGCTLYVERSGPGRYVGATMGNGCTAASTDAAYRSQSVEFGSQRVTVRDRYFGADSLEVDQQVLIFDRLAE